MKANKAPEKIYIDANEDWHRTYTAFSVKAKGNDIEYIRIDVFIEKVCNLLERMIWEVTYEDLEGNSTQHYDKMEFIEDVRNHMKGE